LNSIETAFAGHAGSDPELRPTSAADSRPHGVANTDAAVSADEAARVRRLHDDAETVVGVE
jgi:hypothetical protein